jgi:uncharacterized protein YjbJ (UPF0337 family)
MENACTRRDAARGAGKRAEHAGCTQQYRGVLHLICTASCRGDAHDELHSSRQEDVMDKNRIEGTKHEIKGGMKEAAGKVTGNPVREASGNLEKNAGKIQKEVGKANDEARKQHR